MQTSGMTYPQHMVNCGSETPVASLSFNLSLPQGCQVLGVPLAQFTDASVSLDNTLAQWCHLQKKNVICVTSNSLSKY